MNIRCIPILQSTTILVRRSFHYTATRRFAMAEGGVTTQELEEALKTRLSATHAEINDISGSKPYLRELIVRGMWSIV